MASVFGMVCGAGVLLLFIGIGAFLIFKSIQERKKADASQSWHSTSGQILEARVDRSTHTDSDGDTSNSYTPKVEYSYEIAGASYHGKKISFGLAQGYNSAHKAQEIIARYPLSRQVIVYYDPANPSDAVLERKAGSFTTTMILGIIFLVLGLCVGCPILGGLVINLFSG